MKKKPPGVSKTRTQRNRKQENTHQTVYVKNKLTSKRNNATVLLLVLSALCMAEIHTLETEATDATVKTETEGTFTGEQGTLSIPELKLKLPLTMVTKDSEKSAQYYVDKENSAAIQKFGKKLLISDHASQGFDVIKDAKPGTLLYIKDEETTKTYILEESVICDRGTEAKYIDENGNIEDFHFKHDQLLDENGFPVLASCNGQYDYPLALQTCNSLTEATVVLCSEIEQ